MTSITSNVAHLVVSPKVHSDKNEEKELLHFEKKKKKIVYPFRSYVKSILTIIIFQNKN